jgi:undecaprenyl-diphosphatase
VLRAFILGVVQGLTEFLPVSSSAHLAIIPALLGLQHPTLAFEVLLHFGTLAAVVVYFRRDLVAFMLCLAAPGRLGPAQTRLRRRLLALLALGSVPAAAIGYVLEGWAAQQTSRPNRAAILLVLTTTVLIGAELYARARRPAPRRVAVGAMAGASPESPQDGADRALETLPVGKAFGIGVAQAAALVPGVSRSGVTVSAGLLLGVEREVAARFSFLLSIPAILGAGILQLGEVTSGRESAAELVVGFIGAAVSGFLAVALLLRVLRTHTLWPFIWYRLVAGTIFILLLRG